MQRDESIDIIKGIGILLVVLGHSGCPQVLSQVIYSFHMPLFFIASGIFFSGKYLHNKKEYAKKKIKSLYLPFVQWSVVFLLFHNVFYEIGIINSEYGTSDGQVNTFYSLRDIAAHLLGILLQMRGYDGLLGAYWFLRALFVGCLLLCLGSFVINKVCKNVNLSIPLFGVLSACLGGVFYFLTHPFHSGHKVAIVK